MSTVAKYIDNATLNDVQIRFRNFSGNQGQYNALGQRNFCALLPEDTAEAMARDGWNVKYLKHTIRRIGKIGELLLMRKRLICNNTKNIFSCLLLYY